MEAVKRGEHPLSLAFEISRDAISTRAFAEVVAAAVLAGEKAVRQSVEWQDGETMGERDVAQRPFELVPFDEIVPGLQRAWADQAVVVDGAHRLVEPVRRILRQADRANFAGLYQRIHRTEAVGQRDG